MIYYRLSDHSYQKVRLPGSTKWNCFDNFRRTFPDDETEIIADKCHTDTLEWLGQQGLELHETGLGNAGSLRYAFDLAMSLPEDEVVYFVEDDYLHHPSASMQVIREGLKVADYVTLYDHPDKYTEMYGGGEMCRVFKTQSLTHWRQTVSTCMTFAATVGTLKEDRAIWDLHTAGTHPDDHHAFSTLTGADRTLVVCIPGKANHCDMTFGGMDAQEPWAVQMMIEHYLEVVKTSTDPLVRPYVDQIVGMGRSPGDTLKMLSTVLHNR